MIYEVIDRIPEGLTHRNALHLHGLTLRDGSARLAGRFRAPHIGAHCCRHRSSTYEVRQTCKMLRQAIHLLSEPCRTTIESNDPGHIQARHADDKRESVNASLNDLRCWTCLSMQSLSRGTSGRRKQHFLWAVHNQAGNFAGLVGFRFQKAMGVQAS